MRLITWLTGATAALFILAGPARAQEGAATTLTEDMQTGRLSFQNFLPGAGRIVGGHPARAGEDPWQIALFRSDLWGSVLCGGSIVQPGWIVTAAHCVTPAPSLSRLTVVAGFTHIHPLPRGAYLTVDKIVLHPLWDPQLDAQGRVQHFSNDVALIHVPALASLEARRRIAPINLASEETMSALSPGVDLRVTGWGALWYGGRQTWALQAVTVPLADFSTCQQQYGAGLDETMLCAGFDAGGRDACQGDSGGPLTTQVNGAAVLVGIVSFGEGCGAPQSYGVYARASRVRDWIAGCLAAHAAAAPRELADLSCAAPSDSPDEALAP